MTDLDQIIQDLEQRLSESEATTEGLRRRLDAARELRAEYGGEKPAVAPGAEPPAALREKQAVRWQRMTRAQAILTLLGESDTPLSPAQMSTELRNRGRLQEVPKYISAELTHLKGKGEVRNTGSGWALAAQEDPGDERIGDLLGMPRPYVEGGPSH